MKKCHDLYLNMCFTTLTIEKSSKQCSPVALTSLACRLRVPNTISLKKEQKLLGKITTSKTETGNIKDEPRILLRFKAGNIPKTRERCRFCGAWVYKWGTLLLKILLLQILQYLYDELLKPWSQSLERSLCKWRTLKF